MIRANLIVIFILLVAGGGYFALDRAVADKPVSAGFAFGQGATNSSSTATPDEFGRESMPYQEAAKRATFKVAYHETSRVSDKTLSIDSIMWQQATEKKRTDTNLGEGEQLQTFDLSGQSFVCGYHQGSSCISNDEFLHLEYGGDFALPSSPAERQPLDVLSRLGNLTVPTSRSRPKSQITTYAKTVLGETTTCIHEIAGEYERESCFSTEGVPLDERFSYRDIIVTKEATEFVRSVSDGDFDLPYPVVVPTPQPISPLGMTHD
jgi:hypothetical protein